MFHSKIYFRPGEFLFPSRCFHCREKTEAKPLCAHCLSLLEWVDPSQHCSRCATPLDPDCHLKLFTINNSCRSSSGHQLSNNSSRVALRADAQNLTHSYADVEELKGAIRVLERECPYCAQHPPLFKGMASALEKGGAPLTLLLRLERGQSSYLAKGLAGLLGVQFSKLGWPLPQAIVPIPEPYCRDPSSSLLAVTLQEILSSSIVPLLRCQRGALCLRSIGNHLLEGNVLLVKGQWHGQEQFQRCAQLLLERYPLSLYGLTLLSFRS